MNANAFTKRDKIFTALIILLIAAVITCFVLIAKLSTTTVVLDESLTKAKEQVVEDCDAKIKTIAKLQDELEKNEAVNNGDLLDKINANANLDSKTKAALIKLINENSDGDKINKEELSLKLASEDLALKDALTILITDNTENIDELRDRVADDEELAAQTKSELLALIYANSDDIAENAEAIGQNANVIADNADAIGQNSDAIADNATAIGQNSNAIADNSTAIGQNSTAIGQNSNAIGQNSTAIANNSTAIGQNSTAIAANSVAIGQNSIAIGQNATFLGQTATATGQNSDAIRSNITSIKNNLTNINTNSTNINTNATNIAALVTRVTALESKLAAAESTITGLTTTTYKNASNRDVTVTDKDKVAFLRAYPVGSIYTSVSASESTAAQMTALHGGTWQAFSGGKSIVGVDPANATFNTAEKTGGSALQVLAATNIPSLTTYGATNAYNGSTNSYNGTTAAGGNHSHSTTLGVKFSSETTPSQSICVPAFRGLSASNADGQYDSVRLHSDESDSYKTVLDLDWFPCENTAYSSSDSGSHSHGFSVPALGFSIPALGLTSTYTNNNQQSFSIQDPYTTVYMYKRIG